MSELTGKTAFVTGATGFLGGALVHRLVAAGMQVRALARREGRDGYIRDLDNVEIVMGNITDSDRMKTLIERCDFVFHVAAATNGKRDIQHSANIIGTRNVAYGAALAQVERFIHVSTIAVYGYPATGRIAEQSPYLPSKVIYNNTKLEAEFELIQTAQIHNMDYSIIRPAMIYGPRSGLWTGQFFQLASRRPMIFVGNGQGTAYPIYVDDVVDLMVTQATHPKAIGEIFNCVSDPCPTWRDFLGGYMQLTDNKRWLGIPPILLRLLAPMIDGSLAWRGTPYDIQALIPFVTGNTCYSMDKARDLLEWEPKVSLEDGMKESEKWLRDEGLL